MGSRAVAVSNPTSPGALETLVATRRKRTWIGFLLLTGAIFLVALPYGAQFVVPLTYAVVVMRRSTKLWMVVAAIAVFYVLLIAVNSVGPAGGLEDYEFHDRSIGEQF